MIEARHVVRSFGRRTVLRDVCLLVERGEFALLSGPNGVGKTTLLRVLSGFAPPDSGLVRIAGFDLFDDPLGARDCIGYVPEAVPLYEDQQPIEYLRFRGRLRGLRGRALRRSVESVLGRCGVGDLRNELVGCLSRGQRVRVAIADALLHEPPVLLLDDPLDGLDPAGREAVGSLLGELGETAALLVSTHRTDDLRPWATRELVLQDGVIARDSTSLAGCSCATGEMR